MIVITGAAGFIGSCLVAGLNALGEEDIIVVDRFRNGSKWKNLNGLKFLEYIPADEMLNPDTLNCFKEAKFIFHLGACSDTTQTDVDYLMYNNVDYSKTILSFAFEYNIPVVYASSAATYGNGKLGYDDRNLDVLDKYRPLNPYGFSKQLVDVWFMNQTGTISSFCAGVKFFNVYGPHEYHKGKMSSVVYQGFNQIQETKKIKLFKSYHPDYQDGGQLRDFIYVKDVVNILVKMMDGQKRKNGLYNIGTGKARSFKDLATACFTALDLEPNIEYIEMPKELINQYQYYTQAEMTKTLAAVNDLKISSLEEGVTDYVRNYLNTEDAFLAKDL